MIDIVPIIFVSGMLLCFVNGVLALRAYFFISGGGIEKLYGSDRPNVWKRVKSYRKDPTREENIALAKLYDWIYLTRQIGLGLILLAFVAYFAIFAFGLQ